MPEEQDKLPKPLTDLPKPDLDLPLPEKELPEHASTPSTEVIKNNKPKREFHFMRSFIFGFLFVIFVVLIGGGVFIMGKNIKSDSQQTVSTQITSPSPTPESTANWKTYTNTILGISLQYPSKEVRIEDFSDGSMTVDYIGTDPRNKSNFRIFGMYLEKNIDNDYQKSANATIGMFKKSGSTIILPPENITVTGQPAVKFGAKNIYRTGDEKYIYFSMGENTIVIHYPFYSDDLSEDNPLMNKILSTFILNDVDSESKKMEIEIAVKKELGENYSNLNVRSIYNEDYAIGDAEYKSGGNIRLIAHLENGLWKIIWHGENAPRCSVFANYPDIPTAINCTN